MSVVFFIFIVGMGLSLKMKIGLSNVFNLLFVVIIILGVWVLLYVCSILLFIIGMVRKMFDKYYSFI